MTSASGEPVVGLVGCGRWGRLVLRDLVDLGATVHVATPHGDVPAACSVVRRAEDLPDCDGVVVVTPSSTHADVVGRVLDRGVPVFVEKPFTTDVAAAERLVEQARDRVFVMHKWRYHPGVERLGALAAAGALGPVRGLRTVRVGWGGAADDCDAVWHLAPHDLSIALGVLGAVPTPRAATAEVVAGVALGAWSLLGDDPWMVLEVSTRSPEHRRRVEVHGDDGVAVLADGWAEEVLVHRPGVAAPERLPVSGELPLRRELAEFLAHVDGDRPPPTGADEAVAVVRAVAAVRALAGLAPGPGR